MSDKKYRIWIVGPGYPLRGGPALLNENFCKELSKQGHQTKIISYSLQYPSLFFPGTSQFDTSREKPDTEVVSIINTINPLSWFRAAHYINSGHPDIVIFRYWLPFFAPALGTIARRLNKKICCLALADNIIPHERRPGDMLFTKYFLRSMDGVLCMSKKVEEDLMKFSFADKPHIRVYHPLYETYPPPADSVSARKELGLPLDKKIILFFGLIRKYKGLHLLLEAIREDEHSDRLLLVAGDFYEKKETYDPLLSELVNKGKVIVHDRFVPDSKIHLYFSSANVCVQPYLNATNSGVSMISYFYGLPVIVTRVGGLPEVVEEGVSGLLCEPNPVSLKKTIDRYFEQELEKKIRKSIPEFRKKFSWEVFVNSIVAFYKTLTSNKSVC